jgi:hypothetical protein
LNALILALPNDARNEKNSEKWSQNLHFKNKNQRISLFFSWICSFLCCGYCKKLIPDPFKIARLDLDFGVMT